MFDEHNNQPTGDHTTMSPCPRPLLLRVMAVTDTLMLRFFYRVKNEGIGENMRGGW